MAQAAAGLPPGSAALVRRAAPEPALARLAGRVVEVAEEELAALCGVLDLVLDAGELARSGLVFDLRKFRWDALGRVEEALTAVASLRQLLRRGGRLLALMAGDPCEYLAGYLGAFPGTLRELPGGVYEHVLDARGAPPEHLPEAVAREVADECSHRRYADALDAALVGPGLSVLDIGGGDGHMAEWWEASGHTISLLEVDAELASAAAQRLGHERVTLHDGRSPWPYADGAFDVCLFVHVLHHIGSPSSLRLALAEAARVSRRQVLVMEDQPRAAATPGLRRLAAAVTAEHFRPFGQDPATFMHNIRPDEAWRALFAEAGLRVAGVRLLPATLQQPVPHTLYDLRPSDQLMPS